MNDKPIDGEIIPPNAVATLDAFMKEVFPPKVARDISATLPDHVSWELFKRNAWNAISNNPDLRNMSPALLTREFSKVSALGLMLDAYLGEAYMIVAYNGRTKKKEPQVRVGYKGMIKLARQTGNVAATWCHEVCKNDHVEVDTGYPKRLSIKPELFGDRGEITGYVAVVQFKDNSFDFDAMSIADCLAIRDRSDAWKAFKDGKIASTPWNTDQGEMCKKTAFRRLFKRQEQSPQLRAAQEIEDEAEFQEMIRTNPAAIAPPPPVAEDEAGASNTRDRSTERTKKAPRGSRAEPVEASKPTEATKTPETKPDEPPAPPEDDLAPPAPPDEGGDEEQVDMVPDEPKVDDDPQTIIAWIDSTLGGITEEIMAKDASTLSEMWEMVCSPKLEKFNRDAYSDAQAVYKKHERRLAP